MSETKLLDVRGVVANYDSPRGVVKAVNAVSFSADRREMVGIVGESGCGKSATIRALLGLIRPPGKVVLC